MRHPCSYRGTIPGEFVGLVGEVEASLQATADFVVRQYEDMQFRYPSFDVVEVENVRITGVVVDDERWDSTPELECWALSHLQDFELEED